MATVLILSVAIGLLGLVYYDRYARRRELAASVGAAAAADLPLRGAALSPPRRLALLIAIGIGLHNFAEGLAIGQSAAKGAVSLALLLIVGFGLHNATEGFGIVAPLAREPGPASWGFLVLAGLIGGGPTLIGTIVGRSIVNETLSLAFLGLAAGSILYVVMELLNVGRRMGFAAILGWGLLLGFFLGVATDFVLVAAGL
jgi:ZIP family zinc transporter